MAVEDEEAAYEDAPDEYMDAVTLAIMSDPVQVHDSVLDRATVTQLVRQWHEHPNTTRVIATAPNQRLPPLAALTQLLKDQRNPFTRRPFTEADVVPLPRLKAQIEAWKREKRAARAAAKAETAAGAGVGAGARSAAGSGGGEL